MKKARVKQRGQVIAALDVGSSKMCCFIARAESGGRLKVIGIGHQRSRGVKNGAIVDLEAAEQAILNTVHQAEKMAGETLRDVFVNIAAGSPLSQRFESEVSLGTHPVDGRDMRRVLAAGPLAEMPADQDLVHAIPISYAIDGCRGISNPKGMHGQRLGAMLHRITARSGTVRTLESCVERCHLSIQGTVISPYAAGLASLVDDELELGATVIDLGGGTTSIAVFIEGQMVFADVVPIGGNHVTSDLARGLTTSLNAAERLKTLHGSAIPLPAEDREQIEVPQVGEAETTQHATVPKSFLVGIIQPRLEETFEHVRGSLEASGFDRQAGRRVVLTGGASQLPGVKELAGLILDKQVRMGRPVHVDGLPEATAGPAFATASGILSYALRQDDAPPDVIEPSSGSVGTFGKLGHWLRENF